MHTRMNLADPPPPGQQMLTIKQAIDLAVQHHSAGRLPEAEHIYQQILQADPNQPAALRLLGTIAHQVGKNVVAVDLLTKALAIEPGDAVAYSNLGLALQELGKLEEAVANYQKALVIKPDYPGAWNNLELATKALQFSKVGGDRAGDIGVDGLNDAARATAGYALHQFFLAGFRPHEADASYETLVAALPPVAEQTIPIKGAGHGETGARLPNKVVALLQFGRSGTGLLHSLIDSHPEISTLPSVYLRGYFNEGVWDKLSAGGWRGLPERFADAFTVLFDARSAKPVPSRSGEQSFFIGESEGMTAVGENRDEVLCLNREAFCGAALRRMEGMESVDPMSFLMVVHAAFDEVVGLTGEPSTNNRLAFYHIHNPDNFAMANFLRYAADARLLMMVREPIQNCESSIRISFKENDYNKSAFRILAMLFDIDQIAFRMRESVGIRLEDLKDQPKKTMRSLCAWMGIKDSPSLYQMTAQGKKWWGDPSSPDYDKDDAMLPFGDAATQRPVGTILGEKDQFVLATLFYPFSVRFGYREPDQRQFQKDLKEVRPLLEDMLDFEKAIAERSNIDHTQFKRRGTYQLLRAGLVDRWDVLDEFGDYPHMLEPLHIA